MKQTTTTKMRKDNDNTDDDSGIKSCRKYTMENWKR